MGEAELAVRFAAGEPGSVTEVYRTYGRLVYMMTYRVLRDTSLAEDATKQTFVRAWRLAGSFDPGRSLGRWLATIADRTASDINRRNRHHSNLATPALIEPEPVGPPHSDEPIDYIWEVRRALDTLSDQDRELIRLQHDQQLTHTEISDRLAIPLGSVKSRAYQAHRRLAGLLAPISVRRAAANS